MKKLRLLFAVLIVGCYGLIISSCNNSGVSPTNHSRLQVINALAGSTPINFYLNAVKKNTSTITFPLSTGYISVVPDTSRIQFQIAASLKYIDNTADASERHVFKVDSSYSCFVTGTTSKYETVITLDDLSSPSNGKARVRFINTSTDAGSVDVTVNGTTGFSNIAYKGVGSFIEVPAGVYEFKAYNTGKSSNLATLSTQTLADGKIYTLYTAGLVSSTATNAAFGLNLITNLLPATK